MKEKRTYTSKFKRNKEISFYMTDRDLEILKAINRYRYMKCSQISRLIAPQNKTVRTIQKRLMFLFHGGFLGRITPFIQIGKGGMGEVSYFLDKKGGEYIEQKGEKALVLKSSSQAKYQFLNHALDLSEFRVNLERAFLSNKQVLLKSFIADFEIKSHTKDAIGKNRYKLYDKVQNPVNRKFYEVYPDGLIIFESKKDKIKKLIFLEIDRGTERLSIIKDKVFGYDLYFRQNIYKKFGKFDYFTILFQCNSKKRAENIRNIISDIEISNKVLVTDQTQVNKDSILYEKIWKDCKGNLINILPKIETIK